VLELFDDRSRQLLGGGSTVAAGSHGTRDQLVLAVFDQDVHLVDDAADVPSGRLQAVDGCYLFARLLKGGLVLLERVLIGAPRRARLGCLQQDGGRNDRRELACGCGIVRFVGTRRGLDVVRRTRKRLGELALSGAFAEDLSGDVEREHIAWMFGIGSQRRLIGSGIARLLTIFATPARGADEDGRAKHNPPEYLSHQNASFRAKLSRVTRLERGRAYTRARVPTIGPLGIAAQAWQLLTEPDSAARYDALSQVYVSSRGRCKSASMQFCCFFLQCGATRGADSGNRSRRSRRGRDPTHLEFFRLRRSRHDAHARGSPSSREAQRAERGADSHSRSSPVDERRWHAGVEVVEHERL